MGIKDLLQQLAGHMQIGRIEDLRGKRVAIDCSIWLHKALYASAEDLMDANFEDHQHYVDFILARIRNLVLACGVIPVVVFDGRRNLLKDLTRERRSDTRHVHVEQGHRLLAR